MSTGLLPSSQTVAQLLSEKRRLTKTPEDYLVLAEFTEFMLYEPYATSKSAGATTFSSN